MFCYNCGKEILNSGSFCTNCGARIESITDNKDIETDSNERSNGNIVSENKGVIIFSAINTNKLILKMCALMLAVGIFLLSKENLFVI